MASDRETIKVAAVQSGAEPSDVGLNLARLDPVLDRLAEEGVEFAVLPEFFPTGNPLEESVLAASIGAFSEVEAWMARRSAELDMVLAGSYVAIEGDEAYNRFAVFEPDGARAHRHKLCAPAPEALYYTKAAESDLVVSTGLGKVGLLMCIEMSEPELICHDFRDCALVLIAFAIPGFLPIPARILARLTEVPPAVARRNGVPVVLSSMGGPFIGGGSPVLPVKLRGDYAGRSGIYLPSGPVVEPLPGGVVATLTAEIPLGPAVEEPEPSTPIDCGIPARVAFFDRFMKGRSHRIYRRNLARELARRDSDKSSA